MNKFPRATLNLFTLIRLAFGAGEDESANFNVETAEEWSLLYSLASKLSVVGIAYAGVCKLPKDRRPPLDLAFQWASEAEAIRGHNRMVNDEARRLTELFADKGRRTAILKGAANARLYPDRFMRQCGDIDIWIEGGRASVLKLLDSMDLLEKDAPAVPGHKKTREELYAEARRKLGVSKHHVHLVQSAASAHVEAHFLVSSGNRNPFTNKRIMRFLDAEIANLELVPEGFYVPSLKFALAMQLAHIQTHFMAGGIGLKQITDYYVLLQLADDSDRLEIAKNLRTFGLLRVAKALMWVLGHIYGLERDCMLCEPSERYGKWMLEVILEGGNFGHYFKAQNGSFVTWWFGKRWRSIKMSPFSLTDVFWAEVAYWKNFWRSIPVRIKLRRLSIRDLF
ncbi:MAG: nucleotidyltransferase family protein [Fibrobacter sp.]|uniref:nucleotidyltransferase domain-containing protein n=1 Tax=Fibrobacter sp. TaxID=35828 RepID=UPI0025B9CCC4|nr:nucleotidyltransferase family protein [Fibrobacter sp.]MBQ9224672.1 nucleotidyltransferase family protein [Fibrobacter sp.]